MKADFKTITELDERTLGYSFLFRSFIEEASKDFIENIKGNDVLIFLPYINDDENIKAGIELIEGYINKKVSTEHLLDELSSEYSSLFIGAGKPLVSPWESVALGSGRLFSVNETLDVRKYYAKHRLLPERLNKEPDDHIGFELQFMYILADKTAKALESEDYKSAAELLNDQKKFLENHLCKWADLFAEDVCSKANNDFYIGAAKILKGMISTDYLRICWLSETLKTEGGYIA
ncbi:MAG: molecular chaperone TorD family protein [Thermodesulfovibrionales bacterium]|nr:molecular chaperone TorD family protein [Thermodesulfovibrionales bacterium]